MENFPKQPKKYSCNLCYKSYARSQSLTLHKESVHEKKRINCNLCESTFTQNQSLQRHIKSNHKECVKCESCNENFTKSHINNHIKTMHKGVKLKICDLCDKGFANNLNLRVHKKSIHEKIRYNCNSCDKSFTQSQSLNTHKRSQHQNVKVETTIENMAKNEANQGVNDQKESTHAEPLQDCDEDKTDVQPEYQDNIHQVDDSELNDEDEIVQDETDQEESIQNEVNQSKTDQEVIIQKENDQEETELNKIHPDEYDQELPCDMCENVFTEMSKLESHIAIEHLKKPKKFSFISSDASNVPKKNDLYEHLSKEDENNSELQSELPVVPDMKENEISKLHKCNFCLKTFLNLGTFNRHVLIVHENLKPYKCDTCDKKFGLEHNLKSHISKAHEKKQVEPNNELSSRILPSNSIMPLSNFENNEGKMDKVTETKVHQEIDEQSAPHENRKSKVQTVHIGRKDSNQEDNLKKYTHSVHEVHKCDSCGKSFSRVGTLNIHIKSTHKGIKNHKCKSCGKPFFKAGTLKQHIHIVHKGHRDYKCESCMKSFSVAGSLKKHISTIHEGHKDYKCKSCGKLFSSAGTLKKHIHTLHESQ